MKNMPTFNLSDPIVAAEVQPVSTPVNRRFRDLARHTAALLSKTRSWISALLESRSSARKLWLEETVSLGQKRFLALVNVNGKHLLIGGGAQEVTLLAELGTAKARGATNERRRSRDGRTDAPRPGRKIKAPVQTDLQTGRIKPYAIAAPTLKQLVQVAGEPRAKRTRKRSAQIEAEAGKCA
jgi:hypothetical protein